MEDILQVIAAYTKERINREKQKQSLNNVRDLAETMAKSQSMEKSGSTANPGTMPPQNATPPKNAATPPFPFKAALEKPGLSLICEAKKASPSKGIIARDFPYVDIALDYQAGGADAMSVLTEPKWFLGSDDYLREIHERVSLPLLRKDFTVDPYMIYQAKIMGASAILLICSILEKQQMQEYYNIARELGLSCLVEAHDEREIETAVSIGAGIIGVNNRNLRDFSVDTNNASRLKSLVPRDVLFVSESGFMSVEQVRSAAALGLDAILIGEFLMRSPDRVALLKQLKEILSTLNSV